MAIGYFLSFERRGVSVSISPYVSWFSNYIFLHSTGEWSVLPHAGQIYRYAEAEAVFVGLEAAFSVDFFIGSIIVSPANISILIIVTSIFH